MDLGQVIREFDARPERLPGEHLPAAPARFTVPFISRLLARRRRMPGGPIVGWRVWRIRWSSGRWTLGSLAVPVEWTSPAASDDVPPDFVDVGLKRSGFHLFKDRVSAERLARSGPLLGAPLAMGCCEAFGRIIEHELGYRAQRVVVRRLAIAAPTMGRSNVDDMIRDLSRTYDCDVEVMVTPPARATRRPTAEWLSALWNVSESRSWEKRTPTDDGGSARSPAVLS